MKERRTKQSIILLTMAAALVASSIRAGAVGPSSVVAITSTPSGHGYWLMNASGQVFPFGDALALGDFPPEQGMYSGLAATPDGRGLWAVTHGGAGVGGIVHTLGRARSFGNFASGDGDPPACCDGLVAPTNGNGLWGLGSNGTVQALGRARDFGDFPGGGTCCEGFVAPTNGKGLWGVTYGPLGGGGGIVETLGRARDFGSFASGDDGTGTVCCRALVAPTNDRGLWGIADNGRVLAVGRVPDLGDLPAPLPGDTYVSAAVTPSGRGLWGVTEGGQVGTVGDAVFFGDLTCEDCVCLSSVP
jgi:hypothetical protein